MTDIERPAGRTPWQRRRGEEHDWVSGQQARCRDELIELNEAHRARTGNDYYLYTSRPGDGQTRVVFTDGVVRGYAAGLAHMQAKVALAREEVSGADAEIQQERSPGTRQVQDAAQGQVPDAGRG